METPPAPARSIHLLRSPARGRYGIFSVKLGEKVAYVFREIPCFIGVAGSWSTGWVGGLGYLYRRRCRHVSGLLTLIRRRQL